MAVRSEEKQSVGNNRVNTKVREEGEGGAPSARSDIPLLSVGETMVEQVFPCSLWRGPCWNRYPHGSPWMTPWWSRWICLEGTVACGEPTLEQVYPEGLQSMRATPCWSREKREEGGVAETKCYELSTTPIPHLPVPLRVG